MAIPNSSNTLDGKPSIVPESTLSLRTREYIKGDIVKRSLTSIESAVVVDMRTELLLEHSVSKVQAKDWVPQEKTTNAMPFEARDRVVFDEWIGTVEEVSHTLGLVIQGRLGYAGCGSFGGSSVAIMGDQSVRGLAQARG